MRNFVKRSRMIAKLRLIKNASQIEDAYMALDHYNQLSGEERRGIRKPKIPKPQFEFTPFVLDPRGIKMAWQDGDIIQLKHDDAGDPLPIKNEPKVWDEIQAQLNSVTISGFARKK